MTETKELESITETLKNQIIQQQSTVADKQDTTAEHNSDYQHVNYWNQRFTNEEQYDWLVTYKDIKLYINQYVPNKLSRILIIGCGNSTLTYDMYVDGYKSIISIDYSDIVIQNMRNKYKHITDLRWYICDIRLLHQLFPLHYFDVIIDKACIDSMIVDQGDPWNPRADVKDNIHTCIKSIRNVLNNDYGLYIQISWQQPHFRVNNYLNRISYQWNIKYHTFNVNNGFDYFFYICQRYNDNNNNKHKRINRSQIKQHEKQLNNNNIDVYPIQPIIQQLITVPNIKGLFYLDDFITEQESQMIIDMIDNREWSHCIERRQQFYGQIYYHTAHDLAAIQPKDDTYNNINNNNNISNSNSNSNINNINQENTITSEPCYPLSDFQWLIDRCILYDKQYNWHIFDQGETITSGNITQVLVNEYIGVQGINHHYDDNLAFGDYIITISLLMPIWITLQRPAYKDIHNITHDKQRILLQPRSICIKTLDARYIYTHGITHSKFVDLPYNQLCIRDATYRRISLTLRKLLNTRKRTDNTHNIQSQWIDVRLNPDYDKEHNCLKPSIAHNNINKQ